MLVTFGTYFDLYNSLDKNIILFSQASTLKFSLLPVFGFISSFVKLFDSVEKLAF